MNIENFQQEVSQNGFVIVDFYADWCGPCRLQGPILTELQATNPFKLLKVNIEENEDLAVEQKIAALPTLQIYKDGQLTSTLVGLQSKTELMSHLKT